MTDTPLEPGMVVQLVTAPDWGYGQVQSVIGWRVTVNFEHSGKQTLDLRHTRLEPVAQVSSDKGNGR